MGTRSESAAGGVAARARGARRDTVVAPRVSTDTAPSHARKGRRMRIILQEDDRALYLVRALPGAWRALCPARARAVSTLLRDLGVESPDARMQTVSSRCHETPYH